MSHEIQSSAPTAPTPSSGESVVVPDEYRMTMQEEFLPTAPPPPSGGNVVAEFVTEPIVSVPISIVQKMEADLNATESARRLAEKKAQAYKEAADVADLWIKGFRSMSPNQFQASLAIFTRAYEKAVAIV